MRNPFLWGADWAWGMPLIVLTVVIHVLGLGFVNRRAIATARTIIRRQGPRAMLPLVVGGTTLFAASLLAIEAGIWAGAYRFLDAFPDFRSAMLYSLNAVTSYGQSGLPAKERWHLMGALEALNGSMLFGLTTAFEQSRWRGGRYAWWCG
uniref:Ion transport 2 domain protein n=1 Tax=Solibacter usitatus (strain Ellin6076) TaxID=234267 RepID=Q01XA3_SOLUE